MEYKILTLEHIELLFTLKVVKKQQKHLQSFSCSIKVEIRRAK